MNEHHLNSGEKRRVSVATALPAQSSPPTCFQHEPGAQGGRYSGSHRERDHRASEFVDSLLRVARSAAPLPAAATDPPASSAYALATGPELPAPSVPAPSAPQAAHAKARRPRRQPRALPSRVGEPSAGDGASSDAQASVAHPLLSSDGKRPPGSRRPPLTREESDYLLDVDEAAAMLSIKPSTLRNWAYQRRIPRVKLGGPRGPLRFRLGDLQRYIRASVQAPLGARLASREVA